MMWNRKKPVIAGIGELLWDMFPEGKKAGGAPVNFVYHATASGADGYAISAVGDDSLGNEILSLVEGIGIHLLIEKVDQPTGTVQVALDKGVPSYTITEGVAWDYIPFTAKMVEIARKTDAVCFGTLAQRSETSKGTIRAFLSQVPVNAFRILDINLRAPFYTEGLIEESLRLCNILKLNEDELMILKRMFSLNEIDDSSACRWLIDAYDLQYLILTAGADYSMILSPETISFLETPRVDVVDTVGAGDSFTGAFITSLLKGDTLEKAHRAAVDKAAAVCTVAGAWTVES
ncbi:MULTISPECIES: carbohydrate kinase family protein [unclassified Proteiniphilum]|uniref:carbohydrate kinase family protein n=1 Tax=unclassified Proteiniphilum TaxID=2622718 RepID=UPI002579D0F7|nr:MULTISPECIES: carbohydrate kinase [unclassified Proteiniphilum]